MTLQQRDQPAIEIHHSQHNADSQIYEESQNLWFSTQTPPTRAPKPVHRDIPVPYYLNYEKVTPEFHPYEDEDIPKTGRAKKGVHPLTTSVVDCLQQKGLCAMSDLQEHCDNLEYRRAYEILQILIRLGIVSKNKICEKRINEDQSKNESLPVYQYLNGKPVLRRVKLHQIMDEIQREQNNLIYADWLLHQVDKLILSNDVSIQQIVHLTQLLNEAEDSQYSE
ncbi:hypothetical protein P9112_009785 [Eukaryota sp. TZLM1-RC]